MTDLWEYDINNPKQCQRNWHDIPYVMPYKAEGVLNLTFELTKYTGITSIPFNIKLYRTEIDGTILEDLGGIATYNNKSLIFGNATEGRLDIFVPAPCGKGSNSFASLYQSTIVTGTPGAAASVELGTLGSDPYSIDFIVGEPTPHPIYQIGPSAYIINDRYQGTILTSGLTYVDYMDKPNKTAIPPCHRYKLVINGTIEFYTVPFQCAPCGDDVVIIESIYPSGTVDSLGIKQTESFAFSATPAIDGQYTHRMVLFGYTKTLPARLEMRYASNCYHVGNSKVERYVLNGRAIPDWVNKDLAAVLMGKTLYIDNETYLIDGDAYTEIDDDDLSDFQPINLSLRKCENKVNFVC